MKKRSKQQKDENFPVAGLLIKSSLRPLVNAYYRAARYCDDIADAPDLSARQKLAKLSEAEDIFLGYQKDVPDELLFLSGLRRNFCDELLDTSLFTDLLTAFRQDSRGHTYETWEQLLEYCRYSAAPVGRFMLAVHDENLSTYMPSGILCTVLQIANHIQDIKYDLLVQNRIYLPAELLQKYQVSTDDLRQDKSSPELKKLIAEIISRLQKMLKDAALLPAITRSLRLRMQICVILSLTNIMLKKLNKKDVLQKNVKLSKIDWMRAVIGGVFRALFTKTKISRTAI
ncbi:MAG: squalene/phytoene synthase family protein [Alphaproteobacteria bacterium]|nr:squalene/phytoene synthase family protein [Alphaproteobacteria bacterium]